MTRLVTIMGEADKKTDVRRKSTTVWEWSSGKKHYSARLFPNQQTIIWSGWAMMAEGPLFDEGVKQTYADFLERGAAQHSPPDELVAELREVIAQGNQTSDGRASKKRGFFGLFG